MHVCLLDAKGKRDKVQGQSGLYKMQAPETSQSPSEVIMS